MEYRDGLGQGWRVGAKALERMIDESSGDAHRWLDALLDLRDARTTLDATRAKLADLVRERDEARDKRAHETQHLLNCCAERDKALAASQAECARLREALEERGEHGRKCPWAYFSAGRPKDGGGYEMLYREAWYEVRPEDKRPACTCGLNAALASAPGSMDALRALLTGNDSVEAVAAVEHDQWWAWAVSVLDSEPGLSHDRAARWRSLFVPYSALSKDMKEHDRKWARLALAAIVSRVLGERGKEGGDEC